MNYSAVVIVRIIREKEFLRKQHFIFELMHLNGYEYSPHDLAKSSVYDRLLSNARTVQ